MPYKSEKIRIAGTQYDRRIKLTPDQKEYKPTKAEWAATIREHRRYKEQLKKKGDIK